MTHVERACLRKRRYPSQYQANKTALYEMSVGRAPPLRSYWCPCCWKFHLTKQVQERA